MKTRYLLIINVIGLLMTINSLKAQDCQSEIVIGLINNKGGVYANQKVELISYLDGKSYKQLSDAKGEATFAVPCKQKFDVKISNYTDKSNAVSPDFEGGSAYLGYEYEPNMAEKEQQFAMSEKERLVVDKYAKTFPDTTYIEKGTMVKPPESTSYMTFVLSIIDLDDKPLANEMVTISGEKRKLSFKGLTNSAGKISLYLPKGDNYSINFKYQKNYQNEIVKYEKGTSSGYLNLSYMGTVEYLKRKKAEEERIKQEEKRLAEEKKRFEERCKALKIEAEEAHRREILEAARIKESDMKRPVIENPQVGKIGPVDKVLTRNKWVDKLIVCDLTGSMTPYAGQLSAWYQMNWKLEKNLQFVFFNDGDMKRDSDKKIGSTGGIYYQPATDLGSLVSLMSLVQSHGSGGDCPENNIEALLEGVKKAKPFKEIVMIADNYAPVKDIELLKDFSKPVHSIVCGSSGFIHPDYLRIAWKTKGSVHTMEEDITKIASMLEGESISIRGITYKIMGGEFVQLKKA